MNTKQDKINIANILLTQRCNLECEYCHLVQNYKHKPPEYPDVQEYAKGELKAEEWINIFKRLIKNNPEMFFILYGGEPFLYPEINTIVQWFHDNGIAYTIITNNTDAVQDKIQSLYDQVGQIRGLSSSVDPILYDYSKQGTDRFEKCFAGLQRLVQIKKDGIADDVVAEITADKGNINDLPALVKNLSHHGIWSDITCIDHKGNNYYDFAADAGDDLLLTGADVDTAFTAILSHPEWLVHTRPILRIVQKNLPHNIKCYLHNDVHNVTIDPTGHFRLCLRIRGVESPILLLDDVIDKDGRVQYKFATALGKDFNKYCEGCNWPCIIMSKFSSEEIIDHVRSDNETKDKN